jgi:hypothetical protein
VSKGVDSPSLRLGYFPVGDLPLLFPDGPRPWTGGAPRRKSIRVAPMHQREVNAYDAWREVLGVLAEHPA